MTEWLDHLRALNYSPATLAVRADSLDKLERFLMPLGIDDFADITVSHLLEWRREMFSRGLAAATVDQRLCTVRQFFTFLEQHGLMFENPARNIRAARRPQKLPRVPTIEQIRLILAQPDTGTPTGKRDRALLETMYCAGLRLGEAAAMKIWDIDFAERLLRVRGKGDRERMLPLGRVCIDALLDYLHNARPVLAKQTDSDRLWIGMYGKPLSRQIVMIQITRHIKATGLTGFHLTRSDVRPPHTCWPTAQALWPFSSFWDMPRCGI